MDSPPLSSRSVSPQQNLSHSVGEVLSERAGIPERAPRIKVGDQYYHVVRVVGGHYEAPISEVESLVKTGAIGEGYFSAHKKYAEANPALRGQKILHANDEGVRYENGMLVRNVDVRVDAEDSMNYLRATDNIGWQEEVLQYEQELNTQAPTDQIRRVPPFLHRIATSGRNYGPYTVQQVKGFLLEYTREKLAGAHEIYSTMHSSPERQERQRHDERQWIERFPTATIAINESRNYFKAGYLRTNNLWQMMVRTMQPGEFRLLPEEEALDHTGLPFASSEPIAIPRGRERHRSSSVDLGSHSQSRSPVHQPARPRSTSLSHSSELRSSSPLPGHFRPIVAEEERRAPQHLVSPHPHSSPHVSPRLVRDERDQDRGASSRESSPSPLRRPTPVRPGSSEQVSLLSQQLEEQRRREEVSPSPSSMGSPEHTSTHLRTHPDIPPLDLSSLPSSFHPHHPVAVEVFDRTETGSPRVSQIPAREREVHSPRTSSSIEEEWTEIPLSPRQSPRSSVVVPLVDPHSSQRVEQRSSNPIPRGVQESSMRRPPRRLEFYEQQDFRARTELYPQLRLIASNAAAHEWESRAATKDACRSAHQKMERNADAEEYTTAERHAIHEVIQKKESAGGFGLLMDGTRYDLVAKALAYVARTGRF